MDPLVLKKLNQARNERKACVLVTNLQDGRDRLVLEGHQVEGELGEAITKALLTGKSSAVQIGETEFFLNAHLPPARIVVIGAVHITQAMAPIAKMAGYDLEVIDPRTAFATPERFEGTAIHAEWPDEVLKRHPLDAYSALAAVTHDPKIDDFPISEALRQNCFYVGALGSRKTHAKRVERLLSEGITQEQIDRIKAPIGLDIGAASPQEIAVAVMAEIIESFRKRGLNSI